MKKEEEEERGISISMPCPISSSAINDWNNYSRSWYDSLMFN